MEEKIINKIEKSNYFSLSSWFICILASILILNIIGILSFKFLILMAVIALMIILIKVSNWMEYTDKENRCFIGLKLDSNKDKDLIDFLKTKENINDYLISLLDEDVSKKFSEYKKIIPGMIDHTLLKATATSEDIKKLCQEAKKYNFYSVCVNSSMVPVCKKELKGSKIKICSVVGFPLGSMSSEMKIAEAKWAISKGANEIDMVLNIGLLKEERYKEVAKEIKLVKQAIKKNVLKVILETCLLTDDEIKTVCNLCEIAGADYVKTSTGFSLSGATEQHIILMKNSVSEKTKVKASGGIRTLVDAVRMKNAGADRLGCSAGVSIIEELNIDNK